MKLSSHTMFKYKLDVKACGLIISLLSMCEVIGLHVYIAILELDWVVSNVS